jgi:hypothetical protein
VKIRTIRFARTIQTRPYHSVTIDVTADLNSEDDPYLRMEQLRGFVDARLDDELPDRAPHQAPDDHIPI